MKTKGLTKKGGALFFTMTFYNRDNKSLRDRVLYTKLFSDSAKLIKLSWKVGTVKGQYVIYVFLNTNHFYVERKVVLGLATK